MVPNSGKPKSSGKKKRRPPPPRTVRPRRAPPPVKRAKGAPSPGPASEEAPYCTSCLLTNPPGQTVCIMCNRSLFDPTKEEEENKTQVFDKKAPPTLLQAPISKVSVLRAKLKDVKLWLTCHPFPPIPVGPSFPPLRIGRSRECELILPHESVSKVHVVITVVKDDVLLEDRSTYGTSVNQARVVGTKLNAGDTIGIGPYSIEVSSLPTRGFKPGEGDTKPLQTFNPSTREAMQGRVDLVSLDEVFQQIEFFKKTGTLKLFSGDSTGTLVVYEGRPMFAELGDLRDEKAALAMLAVTEGKFSFLPKVEAGEMTMEGQTLTSLRMEASRLKDEEK